MKKTFKEQSGFAVVFMVLIVSAVTLSASLLLSERSLFSNDTSKTIAAHLTAQYTAEACAERALLEVRDNNTYEGTLNYTISETDCNVTVTDESDDLRHLEVSATNNGATANLFVATTDLSPQLTIIWIDAKSF